MRRRDFIISVAAGALCPGLARAQQPALPVVGFLNGGTARSAAPFQAAFVKGLRETGYVDGQNVVIEYHWFEGRFDAVPDLLADLVRRQVAVIATPGFTPAAAAAKAATSTIPIVFGVAEDPVKLGLVASLARPGGNATGINFLAFEIVSKQLGLLHELVPKAKRFGVLVNSSAGLSVDITLQAAQEVAGALGLQILVNRAAATADGIDAAFAALAREGTEALFIQADAFFASRSAQIAALATRYRLPASNFSRQMAQSGLLMSYGTNVADMFRQVGIYTGSILKGAKPADLPVMQPTKFELVINLQAARSLGLDIPPMLLARADEVIE